MTTHVNLGRVIDIRVDTPLKDRLELLRLGVLAVGQASEVDIEERGTCTSASRLLIFTYGQRATHIWPR
jgi:uncharacterized protein YaeQ